MLSWPITILKNIKTAKKLLGFKHFFQIPASKGSLPFWSNRERHSMTWTKYHEQDDIESYLDYLANTYDFVEVEEIGKSYEGRPMRVLKVQHLCYHRP